MTDGPRSFIVLFLTSISIYEVLVFPSQGPIILLMSCGDFLGTLQPFMGHLTHRMDLQMSGSNQVGVSKFSNV